MEGTTVLCRLRFKVELNRETVARLNNFQMPGFLEMRRATRSCGNMVVPGLPPSIMSLITRSRLSSAGLASPMNTCHSFSMATLMWVLA
jgi:hypothetical protein